jgi:hypothetical protein
MKWGGATVVVQRTDISFPYHSKTSGLPITPVCPSQEYSFQLAREMLESKIVVGMRSKRFWLNAVPAVQNVPFLKNPQNPHSSPANTGAGGRCYCPAHKH